MTENDPLGFISGNNMMAGIIRNKNWDNSLVGNPAGWPQSLRTTLSIILNSKFPMFLFWGPELVCFYNDAYRPSLGRDGKHPDIVGKPGHEAWPEIWHIIKPLIDQVLTTGEATWSEDQLIPIFRNAAVEDVYWTFSYSPVYDESAKPAAVFVTCYETTEKLRIFNETKAREDQLNFTIDAASLGTWNLNLLTRQLTANSRLLRWFGLPEQNPIDKEKLLAIILPADKHRLSAFISDLIEKPDQERKDIIFSVHTPYNINQEKIFRAKGKVYFNQSNTAYEMHGTLEDITQEIGSQRELAESERNFRNLIEHAPVAMCVFKGPDYIVQVVNEKMIDLWGRRQEQVIDRPIFEGLPEARSQGLEDLLARVLQHGERITAHERMVKLPRPNGIETLYVNFVYEPMREANGQITGIIAVAADVTEQVQSRKHFEIAEERARLAAEAADLGTFDIDLLTNQTITSNRFATLFGMPAGSFREEFAENILPEDRPKRDLAIKEALKTGRLFYEARVRWPDGSIHWLRAEGKVLQNDQGDPYRLIGTVLDFTSQVEINQKREEYIAIASHELRNPLTSLKLSMDMMLLSNDEATRKSMLNKAAHQVQRLLAMSNELLNVSKISSGILDLNPGIFDLQSAIEDSILSFQVGKDKNIFRISGDSDLRVFGDKFRIEQVLVNLISNASKYSPQGSVIEICVESNPQSVKISVRDQGIGIETEHLSAIFRKFARVEPTGQVSGYGMGLYISEQIISKHGGTMGVESVRGKGSSFWFSIPQNKMSPL